MQQYRRGQIWIAKLPDMGGSIQSKTRPVLIISNNLANCYSSVVHICPISTSKFNKPFPTHIKIGKESGLLCDSIILCEQSMLVSKDIFKIQVAVCQESIMEKVNRALAIQFDLAN